MIHCSRYGRALLVGLFLLLPAILPPALASGNPAAAACKPVLILETQAGQIEIELHEDAAPAAVRRLAALAEGPIFNQTLVPAAEGRRPPGFFDGLAFDFVLPRVEIATSLREPAWAFQFPNELDAVALGLDKLLITDTAEAMSVIQRELLIDHQKKKKRGQVTDKLGAWLKRWEQSYNADFLIGVSRQEINESLGFVYQRGLASRPAVRGSVALRQESPAYSTPRLTILLSDIPERTGQWMVVGSVVKGLDVADAISVRPLGCECKASPTRPLQPVVIETARIACR